MVRCVSMALVMGLWEISQVEYAQESARLEVGQAAAHGLTRALTANAVQGVSTGFTRELAIFGIGYRCEVKGRIASFNLGYSHPIEFYLPDGIEMKVDKPANNLTPLILTGSDKQVLGQVAANMRALRPPDPYKNKGIRFAGEVLIKKAGKTAGSK